MPRRRSAAAQATLPPLPVERRMETGPDGYEYEVRPVAASRADQDISLPGM